MRRALLLATLLAFGCDAASTGGGGDKAEQPKIDAKVKWVKVEDSIPVSDTGVKYQLKLEGKPGPVIKSATSTLTAVHKDGDSEKRDLLATETDDGSSWSPEDNPFPGSVGGDWAFSGMVFMEDDKNAELQKLYADREKNGLKLMLGVKLEAEGGGVALAEQEITLLPPKG